MLCVHVPDSRDLLTGVIRSPGRDCLLIGVTFSGPYMIWSSQLEIRTRSKFRSSRGRESVSPCDCRGFGVGSKHSQSEEQRTSNAKRNSLSIVSGDIDSSPRSCSACFFALPTTASRKPRGASRRFGYTDSTVHSNKYGDQVKQLYHTPKYGRLEMRGFFTS
jgi:hypothetical protein